MALLEIRDLAVEFVTRRRRVRALDGISLDIDAGEIVGMVGESGAGKSLTGAAVIDLLEPPGRISGGEIRLDGQAITGLGEAAMRRIRGRRIGTIFQDPLTALNPLLTVGEQLVETITTHLPLSRAAARKRAIALLEETGIPSAGRRIDHYPHQFSGGMRQRVVIALALAADPQVIIADEPTTALDVSVQAQILDLLRRLCRDHNAAVLLITHDLGVVAETADRVAVMYAGRIVETGPTAAIMCRPRHPYTAGLMQAIPTVGDLRPRLAQIGGAMPRPGALPHGCAFGPRCPAARPDCTAAAPAPIRHGDVLVACHHPDLTEAA